MHHNCLSVTKSNNLVMEKNLKNGILFYLIVTIILLRQCLLKHYF